MDGDVYGVKRTQFDMVQKADNRLWTAKAVSDTARDVLLENGEKLTLTVESTKPALTFKLQPDYESAIATMVGCMSSFAPPR